MAIELLVDDRGFLEAPIYDPELGLLFVDSTVGGVWRIRLDGAEPALEQVVPFRRGIGGIGVHRSGSVIVSGRSVAVKQAVDGDDQALRTLPLIEARTTTPPTGFVDMTVDRSGRLIVGTLRFLPDLDALPEDPPPGQLLCLDADGELTVLNDDVLLSNGVEASPDGSRLYHVDSVRGHVLVYERDALGRYGKPEVFAPIEQGLGDGLTVSDDGHVLVALAYHGGVGVYDADGVRTDFIDVPAEMTTALCYGGPDYSDLFVVSGFVHSDIATEQRGGKVFRVTGAGRGVPPTRAEVPLGPSQIV